MDIKTNDKTVHLDFLDGMRGLAALYVVFFHVFIGDLDPLNLGKISLKLLSFGHEAVVAFIVLSGFVLTLPVARSPQIGLKGGLKNFLRRRARRILPGYYAALFIMPAYYLMTEIRKGLIEGGINWIALRDFFLSGDMLSHLFLIHNIKYEWAESPLNIVLWSMGTEWWIYFIFALILIPLWRRFGFFYAFFVAALLGLIPTFLSAFKLPTLYGYPHLLICFGLGMIGAVILYSESYRENKFIWNRWINGFIVLSLLIFGLLELLNPSIRLDELGTVFITDSLIGFACAGLIVRLSALDAINSEQNSGLWKIRKFLETKPIKKLGEFSYSIYLTHLVLWQIIGYVFLSSKVQAVFGMTMPLPLKLLIIVSLLTFAYVFYLVFERPFLNYRT